MMNQVRNLLFIAKSFPRSTLQIQAAGVKFGNDKLNMEVHRQEDKMKSDKTQNPAQTLDSAKATSDSQKQYNQDQSMKEKFGMYATSMNNPSFKNKDSTNTTSDAVKSTSQNQSIDDMRSSKDSTKDSQKSAIDINKQSQGKNVDKPAGGYGGGTETGSCPTSTGSSATGSGTSSGNMPSKTSTTTTTTSGTPSYGSGSKTTGSGTNTSGMEKGATSGTPAGGTSGYYSSQTYETGTDKKSIPESVKDSAKAFVDTAKKEYNKDEPKTTPDQDKYSHLGTEKEDRTFTEKLKDTAKAAKDSAKETYNRDRQNYPSSSTTSYTTTTSTTEPKKDEHTILDSIKDTAKAAVNTILGQNTTEQKIKYEDPATKGTPGGYKVDKERVENDTQKNWDSSTKKTDSTTGRTVYETDKTKSSKKDTTGIPDMKDKGL